MGTQMEQKTLAQAHGLESPLPKAEWTMTDTGVGPRDWGKVCRGRAGGQCRARDQGVRKHPAKS